MTEETYNLMEKAAQVQLKKVASMETGTKESKEALDKSIKLVDLLVTTDKDSADYYDKEERRRIEEERIKSANEIERDKQKVTYGRASLEMAKVIVPTVLSMVGYSIFQKRLLKFEETGRVNSTAGRELHLPRFTK